MLIGNLSFGSSDWLRFGGGPFGLKLPKIDESGACHLTAKRRGFRVLVELEGPIFLIGIAGSRGVHDKRALSCDVVKHYLK